MPTNPANFPLPQLTYSILPSQGFAGQLYDAGHHDIITGIADEDLDAGLGVCTGDEFGGIELPATGTDVTGAQFKGVTILQVAREPGQFPATGPRYLAKDAVPILRRGRIWVMPLGDMVNDGPVYCVVASANFGRFRGDNTNASLVPNCYCIQGATASSGFPALISINLP